MRRMANYFLGADVGSSKTHVLISDDAGRALGFGESGPGNHEVVGYPGLVRALGEAASQALAAAGLAKGQISGAGFGVSGYDWPSERQPTLQAIATLGLSCPVDAVNDTLIGLLAGSARGWGIAVVSGTGCNCRGWDRERRHQGMVTGHGIWMGEAAGGSDLVAKAVQAVAYEWTRRGPATQLTPSLLEYTTSTTPEEMLQNLITGEKKIGAEAAPLVFKVAAGGDPVALEVVHWAGYELGELVRCVIRQLSFEQLEFDVVLVGSMFDAGPLLIEPMRKNIFSIAPGAQLVRLAAPPVIGAVLFGMEVAGLAASERVRKALQEGKLGGKTPSHPAPVPELGLDNP
jgi:N-acetylglucosamine kinase-like BadF-type ATPase